MKSKYGRQHDAYYAVFSQHVGRVLDTTDIVAMMQAQYNYKSILPNDHGEGNKGACKCVGTPDQIFERISRGRYKVR